MSVHNIIRSELFLFVVEFFQSFELLVYFLSSNIVVSNVSLTNIPLREYLCFRIGNNSTGCRNVCFHYPSFVSEDMFSRTRFDDGKEFEII